MTVAGARRGKDARQSSIFVKAEEKGDDDGKSTTAKYIRAETTIFCTENKQCNKNPKG